MKPAPAILTFSILFLVGLSAPAQNPVHPVFEGYTPLPNGSNALVFGYYNADRQPIEIPAGAANRFNPAEDDVGQPVVFKPGRQRNVCVMFMPGEFSDNLQWSITWGGETTTTTERGGAGPLYLLEAANSAQRAIHSIDLDAAPHGVCLNAAPFVRAGTDLEVKVNERVELRGMVVDEGLPRGGELVVRWSVDGDASAFEIDDPSDPRTVLTFSRVGTYVLELYAGDSELEAADSITVTVSE